MNTTTPQLNSGPKFDFFFGNRWQRHLKPKEDEFLRKCRSSLKTFDVFISYRRSNGSNLASLLKIYLEQRGFSVYLDIVSLQTGKFTENLLDTINTTKNFVLVLSSNALDRCMDDTECNDWVHKLDLSFFLNINLEKNEQITTEVQT
ncbi:UNVERIFIED_CONTAM: Ect4 [Trichonephila clavipes]